MSQQEFLRPRLVGDRFDDHSIPLEFLKDLAVFEEMIIEVAKAEFLKENPDRARSPRGFTDGISLKLTGIEQGSVIPVISLFIATTTLFPPANQQYFEQARDAIVNAIDAAGQKLSITAYLPEKSLTYFDRFGRSLRDGEAIEFTVPASGRTVNLTRDIRRQLLLASSSVTELSDEISIRGFVSEVDQDKMTCEIQMLTGNKVAAPIAEQHFDTILEAFMEYRTRKRVFIEGIGRFDRSGLMRGIDTIEHVSLLDALDMSARLDEIELLKDGWLDGEGIAPTSQSLQWFNDNFVRKYPSDLPLPYLYPTPEGGIQVEWSLGSKELTLEIELPGGFGNYDQLDMETDNEMSRTLDLKEDEQWQWLLGQLRPLARGVA